MASILNVRKKNLILLISIISTIFLFSPYIFIHFPRTCIPQVPTKFATNPRPDIVILSGELCTSIAPQSKCGTLGPQSYYNRREYVAHHQGRYQLRDNFTTHFQDVIAQGALPAWGKVKILLEELERDEADWIFWIDTDALIANMDIQLERFIDERYSLIITKDFNYLNAGVFMLRVNDWSREFFQGVMEKMDTTTNEQQWMIELLEQPEYKGQSHIKYLPQCSFNSYWHVKTLHGMYRPGDFAVHWAGHNYDSISFQDWKAGRFFKLPSQ